MPQKLTTEQKRLEENYKEGRKWLRWGPYLSERQWGTVREDYSPDGDAWNHLSHDMARSKAYRWGEDGIAGISDDQQQICFAVALWNGNDPFLKERLFGLTPSYGNHGEDVKELYYYLDNTPTHSYMKYLYKYPQAAFPYRELEEVNRTRGKDKDEYEIVDTGVFDDGKYFDVFIEYAKAAEDDICIRITVHNRAGEDAPITVLPTLWMRNYWSFGLGEEKPAIKLTGQNDRFAIAEVSHPKTAKYFYTFENSDNILFTENETNTERLYGVPNPSRYVKDAFHSAVVNDDLESYLQKIDGTKCAPVYRAIVSAGEPLTLKMRLSDEKLDDPLGASFDEAFEQRVAEADDFYASLITTDNADLANIQRQAYAGMLWNKQFYLYDVPSWLRGDPGQPPPPAERKDGRNSNWLTLNNATVMSMPDKWEYPWFAAWDLPFHCITLASLDTQFAKNQLILLLREWYMNPYGQIPAYEWAFGDVNPPVQAFACMQIYKIEKARTGVGDTTFLEQVFQKLLINFTWWVNRKDELDNNVFEGGFLGLDNIGIFDRSHVPGGGILEQADGTAWMGMYCLDMLEIALELAQTNKAYEDMATKFFEHFIYIASSINKISGNFEGSWDQEEGFFFDVLRMPEGGFVPIKVRSLVGLTLLFAVHMIDKDDLAKVPDFLYRMNWFVDYRQKNREYQVVDDTHRNNKILLSLVPFDRLQAILKALLDENEFLSPGGVRSLSKMHQEPYSLTIGGERFGLEYEPGDSRSSLFGGNSNWRGPVWMPMNYMIISALEELYDYFEEDLTPELPTGSGRKENLRMTSHEIRDRLISLFAADKTGRRRVNGGSDLLDHDEHFKDLILFYECFHGDNGRGIGASHQTGWTGLIAEIIRKRTAN